MADSSDKLLARLVEDGTLNGQFKCVLNLEDASEPNFVEEVVHLFLADTRTRLARVRACLREQTPRYADAQQVVLLMKGSNLTFGAERLTGLCEQLAATLQERDLAETLRVVQLQEAALEHLAVQLGTFLGLYGARKQGGKQSRE